MARVEVRKITLGNVGDGPGFFLAQYDKGTVHIGTEKEVPLKTPIADRYQNFADHPLHSVELDTLSWTRGLKTTGWVENKDGVVYKGALEDVLPEEVIALIDPSHE